MKQLIVTSNLFLTLVTSTVFANPCKKCDIKKVKNAWNNIDSLTYPIVKDFLCTFDKSCRNNVEFSEWGNEMLYKVLEKAPELFLRVVEKGHIYNFDILVAEIEGPIHDFDYQGIYDKTKLAKATQT